MPARTANAKAAPANSLLARGQSSDALLQKLRAIQSQLERDVELSQLGDVHSQLCSQQLMLHKDKGVRASTACCLADVLRLSAPNAPFTADELQVSSEEEIRG